MKRSFINRKLRDALDFCSAQNFHLPAWATWSPECWRRAGHEADEVRRCMLGWDITDFGSGRYSEIGLLLFTLRNGPHGQPRADGATKDYCEKLMLVDERQVTPCHFHWAKMEDIINRGGGRLELALWNADRETEQLDRESPVEVSVDGIVHRLSPGASVVLEPGQSITLPPFLYHSFWAQDAAGMVLAGEVSRVNDDARDNRFLEPLPRFPEIDEDEPPLHLLCTEYPPADA